MVSDDSQFLTKFHELINEYKATLHYTVDEDGIHISVHGREIFKGFMDDNSDDLE